MALWKIPFFQVVENLPFKEPILVVFQNFITAYWQFSAWKYLVLLLFRLDELIYLPSYLYIIHLIKHGIFLLRFLYYIDCI